VAEVAVGIGTALGLDAGELSRLRCAALVHDVGKVAVPVDILVKGGRRSESEWETYRLHPYYTQRILERVNAFQDLAQAAAAHHEWFNGQGYHRQLRGEQIPLHGRVLAVANAYTRLVQKVDEEDSAGPLRQMRARVGVQFDPLCYEALVASVTAQGKLGTLPCRPSRVGDLTEREVEVLCLLAQGCNTPQIAHRLNISKKTVEHHITHIYAKIGVTCRTAAAVYAVQQGIV
jgi:HD-GYP domain-containing protein (c-di-GMP phosphodiesterase class II)